MSYFDKLISSAIGDQASESIKLAPESATPVGYVHELPKNEIFSGALCSDTSGRVDPIDRTPSIDQINKVIKARKDADQSCDDVSDTYHTFGELYHHRAILFATIVNNPILKDLAWKSKQHDDPNQPMYDGMFIVGIETPEGQATYHYDVEPYWDMFHCKELERAPKYDGHTPAQAIERIKSLWSLFIR